MATSGSFWVSEGACIWPKYNQGTPIWEKKVSHWDEQTPHSVELEADNKQPRNCHSHMLCLDVPERVGLWQEASVDIKTTCGEVEL